MVLWIFMFKCIVFFLSYCVHELNEWFLVNSCILWWWKWNTEGRGGDTLVWWWLCGEIPRTRLILEFRRRLSQTEVSFWSDRSSSDAQISWLSNISICYCANRRVLGWCSVRPKVADKKVQVSTLDWKRFGVTEGVVRSNRGCNWRARFCINKCDISPIYYIPYSKHGTGMVMNFCTCVVW